MNKKEDITALFKYGIIAPVIHGQGQAEYFRQMEQRTFDVPYTGQKKFKACTFKHWLNEYRKKGIDGLKPKTRSDKGSSKIINEQVKEIINSIVTDYNIISCSQLYRMLLNHGVEFSYQALRKYVRDNNLLSPDAPAIPRKRFEKQHINELWISDFSNGPFINKKRTYLCCIIDDHSRVITGYGWYYNENSFALECTLKSAILRFGVPKVLYCDNGSAFINSNLQLSCARCSIALVHTKPYDPAAKGNGKLNIMESCHLHKMSTPCYD